jgi:predicted RNase H-like nuclease (RuvC/YqgF family)
VLVDCEELFTLLADRNQIAQRFARVNGTTSEHKAQIEGLKTRLAAVEKERDQAIVSRDKWRAESTRQKNQIEGLKTRVERQRKEIEALKLELQTYADTYAESKPPAVIDRLVAAVDSAPLETLTQIDKPRHAALRRVVSLWSAVDHALVMFTQPGDSAQTTNDDDEVT